MDIIKSVQKKIEINGKDIIYEYHVTQAAKFVDDIGVYSAYGIMIKSELHMNDCCHVQDISSNIECVESLFEMLTHLNVLPIHLYDVIEDYIS